ncbi:hypothetical protein Pan241w_03340 [Gimesia alba]|uniref:Uncharacterized protein n=2 Tax=Gimesia alba TaxID=2527973 RepID=A0A517R8U9_9PLAN|nr:hypothetical protein Pan241w_03340 [Gimesia alba]
MLLRIESMMNEINRIKVEAKKEVLSLLQRCFEVDRLFPELQRTFQLISSRLVWIDPFVITLQETKNNIDPWYYDTEFQSDYSIVLQQASESKYLFREFNYWNLDDDVKENEEIVNQILSWSATRKPKNVREIMGLIKDGFWRFDTQTIPKLSAQCPADIQELISWDEKCVLTGTNMQNMDVITREQWKQVAEREQWYNDEK